MLSLIGSGLTTIALGILAYEMANKNTGQVLGFAFTIKMVAHLGVAPIASALALRIPRKPFLVFLDITRAMPVLVLPFVTQILQIYSLSFLHFWRLQCWSIPSCSYARKGKSVNPIFQGSDASRCRLAQDAKSAWRVVLYFGNAAATAIIFVNTVACFRRALGLGDTIVVLFFAASGIGSMSDALMLPRILLWIEPRGVMTAGYCLLLVSLVAKSLTQGLTHGLLVWFLLGVATSMVQTPSEILLKRSCKKEDSPNVFVAHFALTNAC